MGIIPFAKRMLFGDKPQTGVEKGSTGTVYFSGILDEDEYNRDLKGDKAITVYDKMRRSDGQVKSGLLACKLPLHAAHWDVEPGDKGSGHQEIADFVRENLFDGMTITWEDFLRHALLMLDFGFSVFEKVWELEGGLYKWRKFAPRLQKTIEGWEFDSAGGLAGVKQRAWMGGEYKGVEIPVDKLLVFSHEREGSNYRGISVLRAAYKHWYFKQQLCIIDGIAAERHGMGLAKFTYPPATPQEDKDKISAIGERLHAHERAYISLPETIKFELMGVAGQLHNINGSIAYHDIQIARSILAQFINLGGADVGSFALSRDQSSFFLMALESVAKNICDTTNRYAVRQLVDYNWKVDKYPKLVVSGLEYYDISKYSKAIVDLVNAGCIMTDEAIEAELRRILHLPVMGTPKKTEAQTEVATREQVRLSEGWSLPREPVGVENSVSFKDISDSLDSAEDRFVKATKKVQDRQIDKVVGIVAKAIEKGDTEKLGRIDIPYKEEMAKSVEEVLVGIYEYGMRQVKQEIGRQSGAVKGQELGIPKTPAAILGFIATRSKATASVLGAKLQGALSWEALRQVKEGILDRAMMIGALTALSDRELVATAKFSVAESFNMGREQQAKEMADDIDRVIYSAILDGDTCPECAKLDSKEYDYPGAEWDEVTPPYSKCEGHDRCRCIGVYVYKSETKSVQ